MYRMQNNLHETNENLAVANHLMRSMKSFGGQVMNMFRSPEMPKKKETARSSGGEGKTKRKSPTAKSTSSVSFETFYIF